MTHPENPPLPARPLDPQISSIQPGGGVCMRLELAWGYVRRAILKRCFPGYVQRMAACRQGDRNPCPFEVLDPRDVKFYRNQGGYHWRTADDPFAWREHLPFARSGLTELWLLSGSFFLATLLLGWLTTRVASPWNSLLGLLTLGALFCSGAIVWFFRNPRRTPPGGAATVVSPADGTIVLIEELPHDDHVGGPAILIGIFLSIFNVHINRLPLDGRVVELRYRRGKFLNALKPASARENEQLAVRFQQPHAPHRRFEVRQIAGAIARRIVCWVAPDEVLDRGAQFGMIKLGSRTELILPREQGLEIVTRLGEKVRAGESVLVRYRETGVAPSA